MSTNPIHRRSSRSTGFTLVELLVVIAIIGTLVALLIPAVQSARAVARQNTCMNNLSQLGKAMASYESSRQKLPGYTQVVKRDKENWVGATVVDDALVVSNVNNLNNAWSVSWAAVVLPYMDRQDMWDRLIDVNAVSGDGGLEIAPIEPYICPDDTDATSRTGLPALTYSANTGAWDRDSSGNFLNIVKAGPGAPGQGDTTDNGIFMNLAMFEKRGQKAPEMRKSKIRDGADMTIMLSENLNKDYEPVPSVNNARFSWLGGFSPANTGNSEIGTEQQLGIVWVVNLAPEPGATITSQEGISRDRGENTPIPWPPTTPEFARPASGHSGGVNVVFAGGKTQFLRDDIDYLVYQRLLTSNGRKCVDPTAWTPFVTTPIETFRKAPPLTETDYN